MFTNLTCLFFNKFSIFTCILLLKDNDLLKKSKALKYIFRGHRSKARGKRNELKKAVKSITPVTMKQMNKSELSFPISSVCAKNEIIQTNFDIRFIKLHSVT